eukprot:2969935-Rhodomonas_salina.1
MRVGLGRTALLAAPSGSRSADSGLPDSQSLADPSRAQSCLSSAWHNLMQVHASSIAEFLFILRTNPAGKSSRTSRYGEFRTTGQRSTVGSAVPTYK